jgi:hypothetical protein
MPLVAAAHESVPGTKLPIRDVRSSVAIRGIADMARIGQFGRELTHSGQPHS